MVLHILMFTFLDRTRKDLSPNCSELACNLLCHWFIRKWNFGSFQNLHTTEVTLF